MFTMFNLISVNELLEYMDYLVPLRHETELTNIFVQRTQVKAKQRPVLYGRTISHRPNRRRKQTPKTGTRQVFQNVNGVV